MSFKDEFEKSKAAAYHKVVASKILDLMDKLRESNNPNNRKRWIWELLQNAKDVRNPGLSGVDIAVSFYPDFDQVIFKHNGSPFSVQNITFLIEQISTKERSEDNSEETTGKFGTGFLTTHLLSEIVDIGGVLTGEGLPYKQVQIRLDRSSDDIDGIIESVQTSLKQAEAVELAPSLESYDPHELSTSFTYQLSQQGRETAEAGLTDLKTSLPITMSFIETLSSITIDDRLRYERGQSAVIQSTEASDFKLVEQQTLVTSEKTEDRRFRFIQCVGDRSTILICLQGNYSGGRS